MQTAKSKKLFKKAQEVFVGGVNSPVRSFNAVGGEPLFIKRGKGCYIYSEDGDAFIDYVLSWGPLLFGHANDQIVKALQITLEQGTSFGASCAREVELAHLIQHFFPVCEKIRLVNSGTEATMSAIRLARGYTGRKKILKFSGCYHGHVDSLLVQAGSGGLTFGKPNSAGIPQETVDQTLLCEYNDIKGVERAFKEYPKEIAAVILEPIPGNMGVILPKDSFLSELRRLCTKHQTVLIFDEVMSGFRITPGGVQALYQIKPDLTCLGKIIGGGLPCGAFGGKKEIMEYLSPQGPVYQAGTLSGNPLAAAAGIAMLKILKEEQHRYVHAEKMTQKLVKGMKVIFKEKSMPCQINHAGTMFTLFFADKPVRNLMEAKKADVEKFGRFFQGMLKRGVYFAPSQFEANFMSSEHGEKEIDATLAACCEVIDQLAKRKKV
jgi:glutamate-1-semialdehyde 2,1-aminomutase